MTTLVHDPSTCLLGKHLGVVEDPRTVYLEHFMGKDAPLVVATTFDVAPKIVDWGMLLNDTLGDCTAAAWIHLVRALMAASGRAGFDLGDQDAEKLYSGSCGYVLGDPSTDNGGYLLDVLNFVTKHGVGTTTADRTDNYHKPSGFVRLNPKDPAQMRLALSTFGNIYVGAGLPIVAQAQTEWDVTNSTTGSSAFGSWGGHCIPFVAYGPGWMDLVTWGARKRATDAWIARYVDEAYAVVDHDWVNQKTWKAPSGLDFKALVAKLATFGH